MAPRPTLYEGALDVLSDAETTTGRIAKISWKSPFRWGIGAGMFCLEGTGAPAHFSLRNTPSLQQASIFGHCLKGEPNGESSRGPVPMWKAFRVADPPTDAEARPGDSPFLLGQSSRRVSVREGDHRDPDLPVRVEIAGWRPVRSGDRQFKPPVGFRAGLSTRATSRWRSSTRSTRDFMGTQSPGQAMLKAERGLTLHRGPRKPRGDGLVQHSHRGTGRGA